MRPPIGEVGPTVVFNAAFDGDQSVGPAFDQRRLSLLVPETWDAPQSGYGGCGSYFWVTRLRRGKLSTRGSRPSAGFRGSI